jgi:uncharacterized membrane protein YfcA
VFFLQSNKKNGLWIAGAAAGAVAGLFGAGGGMVLVPLLTMLTDLEEDEVFRASVSIILPICVVSIVMTPYYPPFSTILPYLLGSCAGGILAPRVAQRIPTLWLHRALGILILWGGIRYLWP